MKTPFFLLILIACCISASGQTIYEWLELTPVKIEKPVFSDVKDVDNQVFTDRMLLDYSSVSIDRLTPDANRSESFYPGLQWSQASMTGDTIVDNSAGTNLRYYAVYLNNTQWLKGSLSFKLFGNAEIYIDGEKKLTYTDAQVTTKSIDCTFVPGKHTLLVKTVTRGGKVLYANLKTDPDSLFSSVDFTLSPKRGKDIYDVLNGKKINNAVLSYDGTYALVTIRECIEGKDNYTTHVYRVNDKEIVYTFIGNTVRPQWVPGRHQISFLRAEGSGNSLYSYDLNEKRLVCLIKEDTKIKSYTWSPDLSYLIYDESENYGDKEWQLRKLKGIEDRQSYFRQRSWLCKYEFATGLHSRLTWGNLTTSLMDISHDGQQLLFSTSRPDYKEYPYRKQSVYRMDVKKQIVDTLWSDRIYEISCSFSPDDRQLLISGGPSAFGKIGENIGKNPIANQYDTQLYLYDFASREVSAITRDFDPSIADAIWHTDHFIYFLANDADYVHLYRYSPSSRQFTRIECPGDIVLNFSLPDRSSRIMYTASDVTYPPQLYLLELDDLQTKVWDNPSRQEYHNIVFGEVKDWDYNYKKGTTIDGRYYLPADFDPTKKYPLIVYYYGGTTPVERSFGGRYPFNLYAANGYVVYVLQPSGTIGYGQEFSARHQNNWGKTTADEIIAATQAFIKEHSFINPGRVGCMGASYGGFTTLYLTTRTSIFTCAIAHAGISSITGYWGDGYWGYSYSTNATGHSFPWNRKDIYVDQSPLFNADKIHTPLLLIHGTKDVNVPTAQSMQFYTALKLLGKEVELVFVKDSDHTVLDYEQRILWNNTLLAYFAKYLKAEPAWWENIYKDKNL